jgi:outer membrane lipoprotein-sorting protein
VGGRENLEKTHTRQAIGSIHIESAGLDAKLLYLGKAPDKRFIEFDFTGFGKALEICNGKSAWSANPGSSPNPKTGPELDRALREALFHQELTFLKTYPSLSVEGSTSINNHPAWTLKAKTRSGDEETLYFDEKTGLLVRKDLIVPTAPNSQNAIIYFEDYKTVDGIRIAHTVRLEEPASVAFTMKFTEVRHNTKIPDSRFEPQSR